MNRIPLYRQREPWMTGIAAVMGLAVIGALLAWLWRPSKLVQAVPAPLEASAPVAAAPEDAQAAPAQARRAVAVSGRWTRLSAGDQAILAPLKDDWSELSVDQRLKWLELSMRFPSMAVDEQQRVQDRMAQWARMTTAERGAARLNFQEIRQVAALAGAVPRPVSGTLVQAPIGATTRLVTQLPSAPVAGTVSGPRLAVSAGAVDPVTLLPQARSSRPSTSSDPGAGAAEEAAPSSAPAAPAAADPGASIPGSGATAPATGGTP